MQYKSLLNKVKIRIWIGIIAGFLFKFPADIILSVSYPNYSMLSDFADYLILILSSVFLFEFFHLLNNWLDKHYNWDKLPRKRFLIQLLIHVFAGILIVLPLKYSFNLILHSSVFYVLNFEILKLLVLVFVIIIFNIIELTYFLIHKWRNSLAELERFKKENAESRFETLMNQVNPHFLFNSLNTLSSLVYENQDMAAKYIRELSKVYRYVLEQKDNELVVLKNDLEFIRSYVYLFELRFADMISFEFDIDENKMQNFIAPMTIQILIENAVKHNIISKKKPLSVKIFTENNYLVIANNLQMKTDKGYSPGLGLNNIKNRYSYLTDIEIIIQETSESFIVKVPLIKQNGKQ